MTDTDARLYPARPILAASIAVFRAGKVLLAERTKPPSAALFSLPGGLVEVGERLADAALRELAEETGVAAQIVAFNDHVEIIERDEHEGVTRHFVVASFVGNWLSGEGEIGPEARRILWVEPGEINALPTTRGLGAILKQAERLIAGL